MDERYEDVKQDNRKNISELANINSLLYLMFLNKKLHRKKCKMKTQQTEKNQKI